jgi:hypothetical protein
MDLYDITLQISNMQKVDNKFMSMLESVTFTEWDKHTSLLCILDWPNLYLNDTSKCLLKLHPKEQTPVKCLTRQY